ncbi:hypothetical protein D3C84_1098370 [compost metagenome]
MLNNLASADHGLLADLWLPLEKCKDGGNSTHQLAAATGKRFKWAAILAEAPLLDLDAVVELQPNQ